MGICQSNLTTERRKDELSTGHKPIPVDMANKIIRSICKITATYDNSDRYTFGTGFFMNINSLNYLITNNHVISKDIIYKNIEIKIHNNNNIFKLKLENRDIQSFPLPIDITIIEIKRYDDIYNDIIFLDYDNNFINNGYFIYKMVDIFTVAHPSREDASCASGKVVNIENFEFEHDIDTDSGASGAPIILLNNNNNVIQVIGIHKGADIEDNINVGTFIGELIKNYKYNTKIKPVINNYNGDIDINYINIDKNQRILKPYEEKIENERENGFKDSNMWSKPVPIDVINKVSKSICKINIDHGSGTGFFMNINSLKYLITANHVLSKDKIDNDIEIEIHNHKKMKLQFKNRKFLFYPDPIDITIIEIKKYDKVYNDIEWLDYDNSFIEIGYKIYKEANVFTIEHPLGESASCASGRITRIDFYEGISQFYHNITTGLGSSGAPIILLNNNKVIGIHLGKDYNEGFNFGCFIGEIFMKRNYLNQKIYTMPLD